MNQSAFILVAGIFGGGFVLGFLCALFFQTRRDDQLIVKRVDESLQRIVPQLTQIAGEQTALYAREKLESASELLKDDFADKQVLIERTIRDLSQNLQKTNDKIEKAERDRIGSFEHLREQIHHQAQQTKDLIATATSLHRVLSNNQLRGQYGEQVAEDLLKMSGFVRGTDYLVQDMQADGSRPDFSVLLPNGMKINIDAKFPFQNLLKLVESPDEHKTQYRSLFERDLREKVKQVTTRQYINPAEHTVDFVVLFVPNEAVFSYIYDQMQDVWIDALKMKVIFAGPFSLTAIVRMVRQAHDQFAIQKNLRSIIAQIQTFKDEFLKYHEEVERLGKKIDDVNGQYRVVAQTRTHKLLRTAEKIHLPDDEERGSL
jgi:DNA recombination protein RmuC